MVAPAVLDNWLNEMPQPECLQQNPTSFSTRYLANITPIFLVRHPALSIVSFQRKQTDIMRSACGDEAFRILTSLEWTRLVFHSYLLRRGLPVNTSPNIAGYPKEQLPLLIESIDVIYNTQAVAEKLCDYVGSDTDGVQYHWDPTPEEQ